MDIKPAKEYMGLLKQFNALRQLYNSIEGQIAFYRKQDYTLSQMRLDALNESLDSEKAMNEQLTNENESLRNQLAECQWISVAEKLPDYSGTQKRVRVLVYWKDTKAVFTLWYGIRFGLKEPEFYEENEWTESNDGEISEAENYYLGDCLTFKNITHWQPIPQPPKAMSEKG